MKAGIILSHYFGKLRQVSLVSYFRKSRKRKTPASDEEEILESSDDDDDDEKKSKRRRIQIHSDSSVANNSVEEVSFYRCP